MSFKLIEKEKEKNETQNINEQNQLKENEEYKTSDINANNKIKFNNKKDIKLNIKNTFCRRTKNIGLNRDTFKRLTKNKTQSELMNFRNNSTKKLIEPRFGINKLYNYSKDKINDTFNLNFSFGCFDKEQIQNEIYNLKNEIKMVDIELDNLRKMENEAENKFIANKLIIEKVLNIQNEEEENEEEKKIKETGETKKSEEEEQQNKNKKNNNVRVISSSFYITQLNNKDENKDDNKKEDITHDKNSEQKNNELIKNKTVTNLKKMNHFERVKYIKIKNRIKFKNMNRMMLTLKKEINDYNKSIESTSKLIESKKNEGKVNVFLNLNLIIDNKKKLLEELDTKKNSLNDITQKNKNKICNLTLKIKKANEDKKKIEKNINLDNALIKSYANEIEYLKKKKKNLLKEIKNLEEEKNNMNQLKMNKDEEKKEWENKVESMEDIFKEKNKNEKEFNDINNKEINIKKIFSKNELNIKKLKNNIKDHENKIQNYTDSIKLYNEFLLKYKGKNKLKGNEDNEEFLKKLNLNNHKKELFNELTDKNKILENVKNELIELQKEFEAKMQEKKMREEQRNKNLEINNKKNETNNSNKNEQKKDCVIF